MSAIKERLAKAWASDLQARVAAPHKVYPNRRPQGAELPCTVVVVMSTEQAVPGSNVWMADARVVVVCDKDAGGSALQQARLDEIYEKLEATVVPGRDEANKVTLLGFSVDEVRQAKGEKVYSDVVFVTAGVRGN